MSRLFPLLALLLIAAAPALSQSLSLDALRTAYAEPGSRDMMVNGVRLHYVDEGPKDSTAPPIVLLNASYMGLSSWQAVARRLAATHRVIRLDFPTLGLSGPAPDTAFDIRAFEPLTLGLLDALEIPRVHLVGTSSGGIVAFRLAATHPDRIARLILVNAAGLPRTAATDPLRQRPRSPDDPAPGSRAFWAKSLTENFADPARLTPEFITQVHDLNRREGQRREARLFMQTFSTGDPQSVLAQVRAPTLILWGKKSITLSHLEAEAFAHWLKNAPHRIEKYEDAGHYPQVETPDRLAADIAAFVSGAQDHQLVPPPLATAASLEALPFWQASAGLWEGENIYIAPDGTAKSPPYASLTEVRLNGTRFEETEHRFYPASPTAEALAGRPLGKGESIEVQRRATGQMLDASGAVSLTPLAPGQSLILRPVSPSAAILTARTSADGPPSYRIHHDLTGPDTRLRTTFGLDDGGRLRAVALFTETRHPPASLPTRLGELRKRFNVVTILESRPDGSLAPKDSTAQ
ncbi:MAG: alpha/beta fold hydrolase [Polymorphobacter sp.]|uniref:alpha/beta fold hydrolase n=1 Tax=Polymorphobacter sp. TaxID=1909290 RepID=UPI003A83D3DC